MHVCGMSYPVYDGGAYKRSLAANHKSENVLPAAGFSSLLSAPFPYVQCHITVNMMFWVFLIEHCLSS